MSIKIDIDTLSNDDRDKINEDLQIRLPGTAGVAKMFYPYQIVNEDIYIPFSYGTNKMKLKRRERKEFPKMNVQFTGLLRDEQKEVKEEAINFLNKTGCVIISIGTGMGKTIISINMASTIKLKTLVIVNKIVLIKQWEDSIIKVCPYAKVQKLTSKSKFDNDCDFYIMNAINVSKMSKTFFKNIGLLICDEVHLLLAETLSRSLQNICPRYLIGLSATPNRLDGLEVLLNIYFGENKIVRNLKRDHIVYKINTGLKIPMEICESTGKVDWNKILQAQSENEQRNDMIIKIIQKFKDRTFLILCKRVEQANCLVKKLRLVDEYVDDLVGSKQDFDKNARILVGISSKVGTGFDWPKLDALILANSVKDFFIQILGRIFRKQDTIPIVFDLIDSNHILTKHFKDRLEVYTEVGGKIIDFNRKFPEFFSL